MTNLHHPKTIIKIKKQSFFFKIQHHNLWRCRETDGGSLHNLDGVLSILIQNDLTHFEFLNKLKKSLYAYYANFLKNSLHLGLTKHDLRQMFHQRRLISIPTYRISNLTLLKLQVFLFSPILFLFTTKKGLRKILSCFANEPSRYWNPAFHEEIKNIKLDDLKSTDQFELIFHSIPSAFGFNWKTPFTLFKSTYNYLQTKYPHNIGHAYIEIKINDRTIIATGMTGETNKQVIQDILFNKLGMGLLFQKFRGKLEKIEHVTKDIHLHQQLNKIASLSYNIDLDQFKEIYHFINDWCEHGHYQNYGLSLSPSIDSGASCTSFAVEILKKASVLKQENSKKWLREISIDPIILTNVSFLFFLKTIFVKRVWTNKNENNRILKFWDPDLIYNWIEKNNKNRPYDS